MNRSRTGYEWGEVCKEILSGQGTPAKNF